MTLSLKWLKTKSGPCVSFFVKLQVVLYIAESHLKIPYDGLNQESLRETKRKQLKCGTGRGLKKNIAGYTLP